jgi:hypothetical protein
LRLQFLSIENFKSNTRGISISVCEKPTDSKPPRNDYEKFLMEVLGDRDLLDNSDVNASNLTNILSLLTIAKSNFIRSMNGHIELGEKDQKLETTAPKTLLVNIFSGDRQAVLYQGELVITDGTDSPRVYYVYLR